MTVEGGASVVKLTSTEEVVDTSVATEVETCSVVMDELSLEIELDEAVASTVEDGTVVVEGVSLSGLVCCDSLLLSEDIEVAEDDSGLKDSAVIVGAFCKVSGGGVSVVLGSSMKRNVVEDDDEDASDVEAGDSDTLADSTVEVEAGAAGISPSPSPWMVRGVHHLESSALWAFGLGNCRSPCM